MNTVKDLKNWLQKRENVYIGREKKVCDISASKWGNPYIVGKPYSRGKAVSLYFQYVKKNKKLVNSIKELKGKTLGCWCAPKLCHGGVLHRLAGNPIIYQSNKMEVPSPVDDEMQPTNLDVSAATMLDQQVSEALQAMNNVLSSIGQNLSDVQLPIPTNVATPVLSTADANRAYETLLESSSSLESSFEAGSSSDRVSPSATSSSIVEFKIDEHLTKREMFELEYKLKTWRSNNSKSFQLDRSPSTLSTDVRKKYHSAPTTPQKKTQASFPSSCIENTLLNPPGSFSYYSSTSTNITPSHDPASDSQTKDHSSASPNISSHDLASDSHTKDFTNRMIDFLASKIDLLSLNINTLQLNLKKICDNFHSAVEEKIPSTVQELEQIFNNRLKYIEDKSDNRSSIFEKKLKELTTENMQLKDRLEAYILLESEREENIKECLNNSQSSLNPENTDISSLREELEKKLLDLDTRLIECEQYSRRENLVISGIPNSVTQDQLQSKVLDILGLIGFKLVPDDIAACHRLYSPPHSQYPAKVVVRFCNRKVVNFCLEHRDDLQQKAYSQLKLNLRFFDSICAKNEESLRICKWLKRQNMIYDFYTRNGFVKVVGAEHSRPWKVTNPDILRKMFVDIPIAI